MPDLSLFRSLGLTDAEATLYVGLLERGPSSIRQIATATGINRGKAYDSLKRLVTVGLVSFKRKGERQRFVAERPEHLYQLIEERKQDLLQAEESAKALLPSLLAVGKRRSGEPIVRFYEDDDGVVAILRDVLATLESSSEKHYRSYSSKPLRQYLYRRFPNFTRRRIKAGITVNVIAIGDGGEPAELANRKLIPASNGELTSSYTLIYADKVAMISLSANDTPYGVIIEEPGAAATQRLLFDTLWQSLT